MKFYRLALFVAAITALQGSIAADSNAGIVGKPLYPHSNHRGKAMFVELSPDKTGIACSNPYDDPKMWGDSANEFLNGSVGTGVAIGDFDGDGRPDIFVVTKNAGCRLFRNLGNYKFEDVTARAGVAAIPGVWNEGATFVDINNSGRLDIYLCRFNAPNLLYINQGDGTFKEMGHAYGLDVCDSSVMASFCDYDRDGWLDVYITTNLLNATSPGGQRGYLFHNNRNGTFSNVTVAAGISGESRSHSAIWWDFDNDGWPDLYVANDFGIPDKLYRNNRDGTFANVIDRVVPHTSYFSMGSDEADVENTGLIDLFVADMAAMNHVDDQQWMATSRESSNVPNNGEAGAMKLQRSALLLNTGCNRLMEGSCLAGIAAGGWTWSPRFEDLDNDGHVDLFVTNGMVINPTIDYHNKLSQMTTLAERASLSRNSPPLNQSHVAYRNLGGLEFKDVSEEWGLNLKGVSFGSALGDLSGDGNLDIVYTNFGKGPTVMRNDNDSGRCVEIDLRGTLSNRFGIGATVRIESALGLQAQQLTLARGYLSSSEPMLHFGLATDTLIKRMTVFWPSGKVQEFENLKVDQRYTVSEPSDVEAPISNIAPHVEAMFQEVQQSKGLAVLSREANLGETEAQHTLPLRLNHRGPPLAVGDVNGTGRDSVVVGGTIVDQRTLLLATSTGRFLRGNNASINGRSSEADDGPMLLFDSRGQGTADILVTKGGDDLPAGSQGYRPELYLNNGSGGFALAPADALPPFVSSVGAVAAADFNHSGKLSLFIGGRVLPGKYPEKPESALFLNRGGKFRDVTDEMAPELRCVGMVTSALWSDVDGDGWPDLVLTLEWGGVLYFHNDHGLRFENWTNKSGFDSAGTGWWTSIAAADFNGDGRPDFVLGNCGLNTQYRADPKHPALLYSGDFRNDGSSMLVEAYYEGDRIYPWCSRQAFGHYIPSILKRFPMNDDYAHATLEDIVGKDSLVKASRFAATELRSGVLLSQPDGTYRFQALPRMAQISPFQGVVTGDFDGDGNADIFAVQNSWAPEASVGRFDGGLGILLLGDGHGNFSAVPPLRSGLVVPGDAKALVVMKLEDNGWPGFIVSRNNGSTLAFSAIGAAGHNPLRVELHGPPGNPTGIGARISVKLADGSIETSEVYAGSGYYSQSSAACYFGYVSGNSPISIQVRWPRGSISSFQPKPGATSLAFTAPSEESVAAK